VIIHSSYNKYFEKTLNSHCIFLFIGLFFPSTADFAVMCQPGFFKND